MHYKDEQQHKDNMKTLGRVGGQAVGLLLVLYVAVYVNVTYTPNIPWFLVVLILGGFYIVPRARRVMRAFEENTKD